MSAWRVALAIALTVVGVGLDAAADPMERAKEYFAAGRAAFERGDFRAAAEAFERAHRQAPHAATVLNAARAWEAAAEPARAADDFEAALRLAGLDPADEQEAKEHLADLETRVGVVEISEPPGALFSVAHVEKAPVPARVHLVPGEHQLTVSYANGTRRALTIAVAAGESRREPLPPAPPAPARPKRRLAAKPAPREPELLADPGADQRIAGFVLMGSSALFIGGAIAMGILGLEARDQYDASRFADVDAYDRAYGLRIGTNVAWAVAGAVAATGLIVTLTALPSDEKPRSGRR